MMDSRVICAARNGCRVVGRESYITHTLGCLIVVGCQINVHEGKYKIVGGPNNRAVGNFLY